MKKKRQNKSVYYSDSDKIEAIRKYATKLFDLYKLNILLEKELINREEYEKIKRLLGFVASF